MSSKSLAIVVLAALLLAGCSEQTPPSSSSTTTGTSSSTQTTTTFPTEKPPLNNTPTPSRSIVLDDCVAWQTDNNFALGPAMPPPMQTPPGWEPGPTDTGSIGVEGMDCKRLAVGGFERPVRLVVEINSHTVIPGSCRQDEEGFRDIGILNSLFVEDEELATYLKETFGMPVVVSEIQDSTNQQGSLKIHTWSWGPAGTTPSTMNIPDDGEVRGDTPNTIAWFWMKDSQLVALRAKWTNEKPTGERAAFGTMNPPMQAASVAGGNFVGPGTWLSSYQAEGDFWLYDDTKCEKPA